MRRKRFDSFTAQIFIYPFTPSEGACLPKDNNKDGSPQLYCSSFEKRKKHPNLIIPSCAPSLCREGRMEEEWDSSLPKDGADSLGSIHIKKKVLKTVA